jgi:hypothetical protein
LAGPALLGVGAALPYVAWRLVLHVVLPIAGQQPGIAHYPFQGIVEAPHLRGLQIVTIVVPVVLLAVAAAATFRADADVRSSPIAYLLVAELVLTAALAPASFADYASSSRLQLGVLFAALLLPQLRARRLQIAAAVLAFAPVVSLIAAAAANAAPV